MSQSSVYRSNLSLAAVSMEKTTHIAAVSIPAFSHQVSIIEFCKRLVQLHQGIHVTCIFPTIGSPPKATIAFLETIPSSIDYIFLPPVNLTDLPQGILPSVQIQLAASRSMPSVHDALKSLSSSSSQLVALVADPLANEALHFATEFNIFSYIYFPSTVMALSLCFHLPELDETISSEYRDLQEPIRLPGCVPFHGRDLPDHLQDRSSEAHNLFLQRCKRYRLADGVLVNSFVEMEPGAIRELTGEASGNLYPPVYPIGPITQIGSSNQTDGSESEILRWMDKQARKSIVFVSFGSGGTLSQDQLNELALGLELSGEKFLWVVRPPNKSAIAAYITAANDDPLEFLPVGFLERTKEQGLVVPYWAPQVQVLSHKSTGGFLTHCGWNSVLESVVYGVPLIAWPLFAEQKMNAVMLTNGLKVALRPKVRDNGVVEKEEIAGVIKSLMEGDEGKVIRKGMNVLKEAAVAAIREDGSSTRTLIQLALKWKNFMGITEHL